MHQCLGVTDLNQAVIKYGSWTQAIEYENSPGFCQYCLKVGHRTNSCVKSRKEQKIGYIQGDKGDVILKNMQEDQMQKESLVMSMQE